MSDLYVDRNETHRRLNENLENAKKERDRIMKSPEKHTASEARVILKKVREAYDALTRFYAS